MISNIFKDGKLNLSAAKKFSSATSSGGAITIIRTNGSGDRTRLAKGKGWSEYLEQNSNHLKEVVLVAVRH